MERKNINEALYEIMLFIMYSLIFIMLLYFQGIGVSVFVIPKELRKYAVFIIPIIGFCITSILGWYCYFFNLPGTDTYAKYLLIPTGTLLIYHLIGKTRNAVLGECFDSLKLNIIPMLIGLVVVLLFSVPFLNHKDGLTSVSYINNDSANTASLSKYIKEFSRQDKTGLLGELDTYKHQVETQILGGPLFNSFFASLTNLKPHQVQNISFSVFFLLGIFMVYILARELFGYNKKAAWVIMAIFGLNPMLFFNNHLSFQGQIVSLSLALCAFFVLIKAAIETTELKKLWAYLPLFVLINCGISLTYNHIFPLLFAPVVLMLVIHVSVEKSYRKGWNWVIFVSVGMILMAVLLPYRTMAIIEMTLSRLGSTGGWHFPLFTPDTIFGFTLNHVNLEAHHLSKRILLSLIPTAVAVWGLLRCYRKDKQTFFLLFSILFTTLVFYFVYAFSGKHEEGWGGYRSYKILSFYLPLIILSGLHLFSGVEFSSRKPKAVLLSAICCIFLLVNTYSAVMITKMVMKKNQAATLDMADLEKVEKMPEVQSINILSDTCWDILWETHFLYRKKLHFKNQISYHGTFVGTKGEWDLINTKKNDLERNDEMKIITINDTYSLVKSENGSESETVVSQ